MAFLIYLLGVAAPIGILTRLYTQLQQALGAAQRIFALIDEPVEVADRSDARSLPSGAGLVEFRDVHFAYAEDRPVLHGLDIRVEPGQTCAVVGPSGAGKTTTIGLLLRLYDVTGGAVVVDGCDVRDATQASLRESMALVPQEPVLFATTVGDNIRYGRLDATDDEVVTAARAANAHDFVSRLPSGYATEVGERGVQLSAGQRQRIAIARAILRNPRILLLDEATASLDEPSEAALYRLVQERMPGVAIVSIGHRSTLLAFHDRQMALERDGERYRREAAAIVAGAPSAATDAEAHLDALIANAKRLLAGDYARVHAHALTTQLADCRQDLEADVERARTQAQDHFG